MLITVAASGQEVVMGGVAFGTVVSTPFCVTTSSIRLPSSSRSNTKSTSCPAAGACTVPVSVGVQTCVLCPPAIHWTLSNTGEPCGSWLLEQAAVSPAASRSRGPRRMRRVLSCGRSAAA